SRDGRRRSPCRTTAQDTGRSRGDRGRAPASGRSARGPDHRRGRPAETLRRRRARGAGPRDGAATRASSWARRRSPPRVYGALPLGSDGVIGLALLRLVPGELGGSESATRGLLQALARAGTLPYRVYLPPAAPAAHEGLPAAGVSR